MEITKESSMPPKEKDEKLLTETELELMSILWSIDLGSVRQVMEHLPEERSLAYTSVSTIVRILEKKGFVEAIKEGKTHIYRPLLSRREYEKKGTSSLVENLFDGSSLSLVKCLIDNKKLTKKELSDLQNLIDQRLSK